LSLPRTGHFLGQSASTPGLPDFSWTLYQNGDNIPNCH
jgi:hypothetical protein